MSGQTTINRPNPKRRAKAGPGGDFGPQVARSKDGVLIPRHDRVVLRTRPDADFPDKSGRNVFGAQATCPYDRLYRRGTITPLQREACDKYAIMVEQEHGANDRQYGGAVVRLPPWMQGHPTITQVGAVAALRSAHTAVGPSGAALLRLFIRDGYTIAEIAHRRFRGGSAGDGFAMTEQQKADMEGRRVQNEQRVLGEVDATLTRLVEHFGV